MTKPHAVEVFPAARGFVWYLHSMCQASGWHGLITSPATFERSAHIPVWIHSPNTAGAYAFADTAADATGRIRHILKTVFILFTVNGFFRARFETHFAITTRAATDAAAMLVLGTGKILVMTLGKVGCVQPR